MDYLSILQSAIAHNRFTNKKNQPQDKKPKSELVYQALLSAEKNSHQQKNKYELNQLLGDWRLIFITGTKDSQKKLGGLLGKGFYLPPFIKIIISYYQENNHNNNQGKVDNKVEVGLVKFNVTGPIKYIDKKNILAFDFNHLIMSILGVKTFQTNIRGGRKDESPFYEQNLNNQAFFSYFLVTEDFIAARGRGGGLALWRKEN
jgi:hypothetical protein